MISPHDPNLCGHICTYLKTWNVESSKNSTEPSFLTFDTVRKSTLFKNIKLLFNGGFDSDEFLSYREVILSNIVQMVQFVLRALITLFPEHKIEKPENEEFANSILRLDCEDFIHILRIVDENFITRVQKLWFEEPAILRAYHYRHRVSS